MKKIICAGWIWDGILDSAYRNYAIYIEGSRVQDIGPADTLRCLYPDAEWEEWTKEVIIPGFIDAHDHGRGISPSSFGAKDSSLETWIPRLGEAAAPPYAAAYYDGLMLASSGVTTVVHCHNPVNIKNMKTELLEVVRGYNDAGIRVVICPPYTDQNALIYWEREKFLTSLPEELREEFSNMVLDKPMSLDDYFALIEELKTDLEEPIRQSLADIQLYPAGAQWCSDEALIEIKKYGVANHMRIHMHLLETKYQMHYAEKRWNKSMVCHLNEINFLGPWLTCAHSVWISEEDMRILSQNQVGLVTNPSSNLRLRSGVMPLKRVLEHTVTLGVGLDGCALDDDQDYGRELRIALYNNALFGVNAEVSPRDLLKAALAGGRKAVGEGLSPGCLKKGVLADFVCIDYDELKFPYVSNEVPLLSLILQKCSRRMIKRVYRGGRPIDISTQRLRAAGNHLAVEIGKSKKSGAKPTSRGLVCKIYEFYEKWEGEKEE